MHNLHDIREYVSELYDSKCKAYQYHLHEQIFFQHMYPIQCTCIFKTERKNIQNTVKHVYSDHAYNEMTLITKH